MSFDIAETGETIAAKHRPNERYQQCRKELPDAF